MKRRTFIATSLAAGLPASLLAEDKRPIRILLRSSWQTVNIGDIAHTPGMLALLDKHLPHAEVTLWPSLVDRGVEKILRDRFPKLKIALTRDEKENALGGCDFFLHGSGPGMVGHKETELARKAGKAYGFGGITLSDDEIKQHRVLLAGAKFVFLRDSDSMLALTAVGIRGSGIGFGPDATFAIDLRDEPSADALLKQHGLESGKFLCAIPRLRWTPYWEIHPESRKPDPERIRVNEEFAEKDHAKLREAITTWVRETGMRVLLTPEMSYAVPLLKSLLFDKLPDDVKPMVSYLDRYWLTAEACSVYARAAAIVSMEQHSPIMGIAAGVPSVLVRQPTDTRKGRMWYDLGMEDWVFEIEASTGNQAMEKNEAGVWSITVGPVEPNLYPYHFVVDGVGVADPSNPDLFPNERFKPSLVDIPADPPLLHAVRDVPRGELTTCYYESKTLKRTRPLIVYTPPGYRAGSDRYPVLYLVSGTTDTEETWVKAGRVNVILDNLIADKKAVPMIVAMPYGNMMGAAPMPTSPEAAQMYQVFNDELTGNVLPHIEANYRVLADREHRAIAGFSRGGGQSLFTAFKNPDKFAWIGSYAAYLTPEVCDRHFPDLARAKPSLLWLGVGKGDFLYQPALEFEGYLKTKDIPHRSLVTEGGHTWMNARHYLAETLPLFFQ